MAYKGKFKPKHPEKYIGNPNNIVWRSTWELHVMQRLDSNESIIEWASEELFVNYVDPFNNKWKRYYPDFFFKVKNKEGLELCYIVEVKPYEQCAEPKKPQKANRTYYKKLRMWGVNSAKWQSAKYFCEQNGWKFQVWNEKNCPFLKKNNLNH